jgi:protein kinase C substrate 80K-H
MLVYLGLLLFPVHVICGRVPQTRGVAPELRARYAPSASTPSTWRCLDDSHVIPWTAVNDDYCDCPDGSDEPGTISMFLPALSLGGTHAGLRWV